MIARRRSYFTLIEIVLAIALLSLIVGVVGFNIRNLVGDQKFKNDVNTVTDTLNRAQQLMLIYDQTMLVRFKVVPGGIQCRIEASCHLDPTWEKWVVGHSKVLKEIHCLAFDDLNHDEKGGDEKIIRFYPNGGLISKGVLALSSAKTTGVKGASNAFICLPGYPTLIKSTATPPENCVESPDSQISFTVKNEVLERMVKVE